MNVRQQRYKENRIKGLSAYRSAIEAGYAHNTAWNAHKNIERRCGFSKLMAAHGLDDDTLLKVMADGIQSKGKGGKPDIVAKAFVEIAMKLNGRLKEKVEHSGKVEGGANVTIHTHPQRTFIFQDVRAEDIHDTEGPDSNRVEQTLQSP